MPLQSQLFRGDPKLEAAAVSDPAHSEPGTKGPHVGKIQQALIQLDGAAITADSSYGPATAAAVAAFKRKRSILNFQGKIDDIVGIKTMAALDSEMLKKERGGGGAVPGGNRRGFVEPVNRNKRHLLVYFSGVADDRNLGGVPLPPGADEVFTDMGNLTTVNSDKLVIGFGGSLKNKQVGVAAALAIIATQHDRRGKLIIYGFSAGGINSLDLCRALNSNPLTVDVAVNLLVTVDVAGAGEVVDRSVPNNVGLNRNYFQTTPSLRGSKGGPNSGRNVQNISKNNSFGTFDRPDSRHGRMQDLTRGEAKNDMQSALTAVP
jgi:hypothetical protein